MKLIQRTTWRRKREPKRIGRVGCVECHTRSIDLPWPSSGMCTLHRTSIPRQPRLRRTRKRKKKKMRKEKNRGKKREKRRARKDGKQA